MLLENFNLDPENFDLLKKLSADLKRIPPFNFREYNQDSFVTDPNVKLQDIPEVKKLQTLLTKAANVQIEGKILSLIILRKSKETNSNSKSRPKATLQTGFDSNLS